MATFQPTKKKKETASDVFQPTNRKSYDSTVVYGWETTKKQALDILNNYNNRINKSEWLDKEDRKKYRSALDSYIETSNYLRGINKMFGEGYSDEDEKSWLDSVSSLNKGYEGINSFYDQFANDREYNNWYSKETKRKEYESTLSAEDFDKYSQAGSNIKNPKKIEDVAKGEAVGNPVAMSRNNADYIAVMEINGGNTGDYGLYSKYRYMKEEEVAVYNYYLGKGDTAKAAEYLDYLEETLNERWGGQVAENIDGTGWELLHSGLAGIEQAATGFRNIGHFITGTEGEATTSTQYAHAQTSSNNEGLWKVANDLANTTGNMVPSIVVGTIPGVGPLLGAMTLGVSATGNAYADMRRQGYDEWQSRGYAALVGASEAVLQYALGGISKLGGKVTGNAISKFVARFDNAIARTAITLGGNMASEGLEEAIQTVLEPAFKAFVTGEEFEAPEWEDVWYSALLGALSAGMLEGVPTIAGTVNSNYKTNVQMGGLSNMGAVNAFIKGNENGTKGFKGVSEAYKSGKQTVNEMAGAYVNEALEIDPDNAHAQRMQARLNEGKDVSGYQINRLVEANENALVSQDKGKMKSAVESRLAKLGENGDISKLADVIVKAQSGEKLTRSERSILVNSKYGRRVSTELNPQSIESGEYTSNWAENLGTERINVEAYNRGIAEEDEASVSQAETTSVTENTPVKENASEGKISASTGKVNQPVATAVMKDGEGNDVNVKVAKIADVENGEASLELEDGKTVKASEVDFGEGGIGLVYKAATEMISGVGGFNVDAANLMVKGVNPNISSKVASLYVHGFNEAYRYGAMGYPVSALASGEVTSRLSEKQRETAYNLGKAYGEGKVAEKQAKIDSTVSIKADKDSTKATKKGKVYFDGSAVGKTLTERQKASLKGLRVIAEGMGVNIHIFESKVVDGKRQGANGWYDPVKKEIHLDLYAGVKGDSLMLFTASHELTHHIREVAPAKFKVFADALLEEYTKNGVSLDALIEKKLDDLKKNGRLEGKTEEQAYDLAYEEVVADACEAMLVDSNAIEALSRKIQARDKGLWETIKDFIAKLVARIKAAYEGLDPDSREGKLLREMKDSSERLQKLWVDALIEASDTVLTDNGIIVDSKTDSASLYSVRDLLDSDQQQKVSKALAERFGVTQTEAMDWLKAETSLASLILNPKYSQYLDYTADPNEEAIKSNSDYPQGTVDFSNICKKRRDFTEVMNRVLRNFPNHVFAATDLAKIRTIMEQEGMEVACAICYVEDRRQLDSVVAQNFIDSLELYRNGSKTKPDGTPFNANQLKAFSLIEGDTYTPSIYELISLEGRNSLKVKNPAMEEAWVKFNNARGMQSVRLLLNDAEYKRQILKYSKSTVNRKNDLGGLRIYSFSDMEMFHLIDIIQVITDSATVGLSLQGYTKVNEYAKAVKDTGEKLNRSLIPKGDLGYHMENGRVVLDFDTVEGIDINHPDFFDNIDNPNVGNIVIGINATQIKAAMTSRFIDQIIPFHTGQSNEVLGEKGIAAWDNYKDFQSERDAKTKKKSSHQINIYTEVINAAEAEGHPITNKVEFVNKFLEVCKENNLIPRFSDFLNVDENGDYVYTEGYHKFLVDFKTFDQNTGEYLPQMPVKPIFDNEYITKLLTDYVKTQQAKDAEFTKAMPKVLDRITNEIVKPSEAKYSDRDSSYIDAVNRGDMETAQRMVDEAAKEAGYTVKAYHGTKATFTVFDKSKIRSGATLWASQGDGFYFTENKDVANKYSKVGKVVDAFLKMENAFVFVDKKNNTANKLLKEFAQQNGRDFDINEYSDFVDFDKRTGTVLSRVVVGDGEAFTKFLQAKKYDGIVYNSFNYDTNKSDKTYVVFSSEQVKSADPVTYDDDGNVIPLSERFNPKNSDIRYSDRNPYSYEALTSKPDMKLATVGGNVPNNRADIVAVAKKNAAKVGKFNPKDGNVSVRVEDIGVDVILGKDGLKHSLDRRMSENAPVVVKAGEIISNSIRINELNPRKAEVDETYVLIGAAKDANGELYIVRSVVNRLSNELTTMDVLYAINAKKENRLRSMRPRFQHLVTDSTISIAQLLDFVNSYFPDILPESVLRHYGHTERPKGELGKSALYQDRNPDSYSNRSLLAGALETAVQNDIEREKLRQYKQKIDLINSEEQKLHDLREQIKELSFKKGPRDTEAIRKLQFEANQAANRINTYDKQLLNLESTKALKGVLEREKALARKRDAQKYKEAIDKYRERSAKAQRELMDRYQESRQRGVENRNKTAMRHKIKDVVNELNQYLLKGTKDKHVPIELQRAVAEALDAVNMDTVGAEVRIAQKRAEMMSAKSPEVVERLAKEIEHIQEMGGNMAKKISRLKTAYDSIINSDDPLIANSHDDVISSSIEKVMEFVGETPLRDMSLPQLEAVYDMYRMVLHSIRTANKAFKAAKSEEISVIANRVMEEIDKLGKKKTLQTKVGQVASEFNWNNQKPVYAFERIGSETFSEVFNNVRAGEDAWAQDMTEAQEFREEQYKKHKYDSWDFKKRFGFTSASGMHFELTLDQIMSLYAYSKRDQAAEHLKRGGIVFDETTEVTAKNKLGIPVKFNPTEATAYNISEQTLADIISKLTAEQKAFVDEMQDYLSTVMGDKGNEVSLELYGVKLFKEKHYFPLKSATQFMAKAKEQQKGEVKIKNSGFTKETVSKANNPIVLTPFMDVWAGHVNEMSMYHAFTLALEDFYRVYNYKTPTSETMATESVEMFLQNAHGKAATKYIDQLLKDLNGGARVDSTVGIINKLTGIFKKSAVFASASVVVQQPSAIARATALVDAKYFVGMPSGKKHSETWAEVKKYAPVAVIKEMGYFDTGMGKSSTEWLKGEKTWKDKVDDFASKAPALADEYAWCAIWNAVKRETAHNNPKLNTSSDEFLKLVGERFTEVIVKTQVYDSVLARSANMRSKDTGMKMATAFMGEPTTSLNMLQDALIQGKRGNKKYAAKAIGGVVSSMVLNAILVSIVYAGRDDDEDKTYAEKYINTLTKELLDSFNPLTLVPFFKDIVSIVQGYDIERSDMAVITDLINAWNNLDSDNRSVYRKVEDFGGAIAAIFGLPVKNVMRDVRGMYNTINSFINGEKTTGAGIGNAVGEAITGKEKSNGQQLYEAMVKGDTEQIERVKGRFEDQNDIDSAIRKALRDNDPRMREAAEAYINKDYATYNALRDEIVNEGVFDRKLVTDALKAEYNYLKDKANNE